MDDLYDLLCWLHPPTNILEAPGIYHAKLNWNPQFDDLLDAADVLPYPSIASHDLPASMALTEFHFVVLYQDRIQALCHLNEKMTYEEALPLVMAPRLASSIS